MWEKSVMIMGLIYNSSVTVGNSVTVVNFISRSPNIRVMRESKTNDLEIPV